MSDTAGIPVNIYLAGDSTMSHKPDPENPERGWGMYLPEFFHPDVRIYNRAMNGRSTKSFSDEGRWAGILADLQPGDYVFIQFGHNDSKKEDPSRYAAPQTEYRNNLIRFIETARKGDAEPVLFTSICRRKFNATGELENSHGAYPQVVRDVAGETDVALVDLEKHSRKLIESLGMVKSKKIFLWIEAGTCAALPEGKSDDTHFCEYGARLMAGLAMEELAGICPGLAPYIKETQ